MTRTATDVAAPSHCTLPELVVSADTPTQEAVLGRFVPGTSAAEWPSLPIGLRPLGEAGAEVWRAGPLRGQGGRPGHYYAHDGQLMMVTMECLDDEEDPAELVQRCYQDLLASVRSAGYPHLLRIWNYLPAINAGAGDQERYRRFCVGRAQAMAEFGVASDQMCAATAIGGHDRSFRLFALAGKAPGQSIENPRQLSAWHYPADYGPVSPAFARATAVLLSEQRVGLLVSGTASVLGHETAHVGSVQAQTEEALRNLDSVLGAAAERMSAPGLQKLNEHSAVRLYVRHATDWPLVEAAFKRRWPAVRVMGLHGDICREDLLIELEAWHCAQHEER